MKNILYKIVVSQLLVLLLASGSTSKENIRFNLSALSSQGRIIVHSKIYTDTIQRAYVLASGVLAGKHTAELFKRTECEKGKIVFHDFEIDEGGTPLPPPTPKTRRIEFYDHSITCAYANENFEVKDCGVANYQSNYERYAPISDRHFNAQYHCIAKRGIGILGSRFSVIMPEIDNRTDAADSTLFCNFSKYTPKVLARNLLQNNACLVKKTKHGPFINRFGIQAPSSTQIMEACKSFVLSIRRKYPEALIVGVLGYIDATKEEGVWRAYIKRAVSLFGDAKIVVALLT